MTNQQIRASIKAKINQLKNEEGTKEIYQEIGRLTKCLINLKD